MAGTITSFTGNEPERLPPLLGYAVNVVNIVLCSVALVIIVIIVVMEEGRRP